MTDFRTELYEKYVTAFKGMRTGIDEAQARASFWVWCEHKYWPLLRHLDRHAPILELGCGPGVILEYLRNKGFSNVQGIDVSSEQVAMSVRRGLNADVADGFEFLSTKDEAYDAVLALDFIEHFSRHEILKLTQGVFRALKPGGTFLLQTPNGQGLFAQQVAYGDLTHLTILTPESVSQVLRFAGFDLIQCLETGPVPKNLPNRIRLLVWQGIKRIANVIRKIECGRTQEIWTENFICASRKASIASPKSRHGPGGE